MWSAPAEGPLLPGEYEAKFDPWSVANLQTPRDLDHCLLRWGMTLGQTKDGSVRVAGVLPYMPAAHAGLVTGDEVITIEGKDVEDKSPEQIVEMLGMCPGVGMMLVIKRDDQARTLLLRRGIKTVYAKQP